MLPALDGPGAVVGGGAAAVAGVDRLGGRPLVARWRPDPQGPPEAVARGLAVPDAGVR